MGVLGWGKNWCKILGGGVGYVCIVRLREREERGGSEVGEVGSS